MAAIAFSTSVSYTNFKVNCRKHYRFYRKLWNYDNSSMVKIQTKWLKSMNLWVSFILSLMTSKLQWFSMIKHLDFGQLSLTHLNTIMFLISFTNSMISWLFLSKQDSQKWKNLISILISKWVLKIRNPTGSFLSTKKKSMIIWRKGKLAAINKRLWQASKIKQKNRNKYVCSNTLWS